MCSWCCEERARAPRTALSCGVGSEAAPAAVLCLASHVACSVSRCAPRAEEAKIFAGPQTRVCLMGPDQDPRHAKRVSRHGGLKSRFTLRALERDACAK
eukprot:7202932-Prymnesium_polylepis.1